ncbi:hypothetical protein K0T92_24380, partial [Paenibacillus oenotherae]
GNTSVNRYTYDLWGNPLTTTEGVENPFRYSGEMWDQSAGLQYLRARWYDPSMGQFISKDTYEGQIDNPLTMNLYTYVHNNPSKFIDPSGHVVETIVDIASIGWSAYELYENPSWGNAGFLLWDIAATLLPFVPGSYVAKGTKMLMKADVFAKARTGVWAKSAVERGREIEDALGGMSNIMGNNFKTIDKFVAGEGLFAKSITSIKSIDVTLSSYNKGNNLLNILKVYTNSLASYTGHTQKNLTVLANSSTIKNLEVALPPVELTKSQSEQLQMAIDYAKDKGVNIIIKIVE